MARKRKELKKLDYKSQVYWDKLLESEGLSMKKGTTSKISYVGTSFDLEIIEKYGGKNNSTNPAKTDQ